MIRRSNFRFLEVELQNKGIICLLLCLFVLSDLYDGLFCCYSCIWLLYVLLSGVICSVLLLQFVKLVSQVSTVNCKVKDRYFDKMQKPVRFQTRNLVRVFLDLM